MQRLEISLWSLGVKGLIHYLQLSIQFSAKQSMYQQTLLTAIHSYCTNDIYGDGFITVTVKCPCARYESTRWSRGTATVT